ncbi:hypothetical protein SAMN05421780_10988 [Flexibacter flexilis DSM 6793]|uniref:Uncharacterized protein n=1 Tax=Flexibacter flexilis DSM 6793 TaxID=927664 RepID=A0A1I1LR02_9BACT|nr:hypothetical protein [Flexibacter flexilis]SFC75386.1 hypothetical protein SAMN05421780_10988 [Flexibacter flexilis DSM 6793]
MKRKVYVSVALIAALQIGVATNAHAQLGKLLNKVAEKTLGTPEGDAAKALKPNKKQQKELDEDLADETLEKRTDLKKDAKGRSGIYYFSQPVAAMTDDEQDGRMIAKIYLEFSDKDKNAKVHTRYEQLTDRSKKVPLMGWSFPSSIAASEKDKYYTAMMNIGKIFLREAYGVRNMKYPHFAGKGESLSDGVEYVSPQGLFELEPGLFYISNEPYAASNMGVYGHNLPETQMYLFMYKKGMDAKIKDYPISRIKQMYEKRMDEIEKNYSKENQKVNANYQLKPTTITSVPKDEYEAAKEQFANFIVNPAVKNLNPDLKYKFVYAYPLEKWISMYVDKVINGSVQKTTESRRKTYVVVCTDQTGKYWTTQYLLVEKAPVGVYFEERWSDDYDYLVANTSIPVAISKQNALKYQGKLTVK